MTTPLSEQLEQLAEKATPGPWVNDGVEPDGIHARIRGTRVGERFKVANAPFPLSAVPEVAAAEKAEAEANAALIVALRNALPEIIAALRRPIPADVASLVEPAAWICYGPDGEKELEHPRHTPALTKADEAYGWTSQPLYTAAQITLLTTLASGREDAWKDTLLDEDWLEETISDSLEMDWRPRDAAKLIIARFLALPTPPTGEA